MKKMNMPKYLLAAALSVSIAIPAAVPTYAESAEDVQQKIDELKQQQSDLEDQLSSLKQNKTDTESYISELDSKISDYESQLSDIQDQIDSTNDDINATQDKLDAAKEDEANQYEALKARIQVMYESGESDYLSVLLGADDLQSMLNDKEYIKSINTYDKNLLSSLAEIREEIEGYEAELEDKQSKLESQQEEYQIEQESLQSIMDDKQEELASIGEDIDTVSSDISDVSADIDNESAYLNDILAQAAAAEAAQQAAEQQAAQEQAAQQQAAQQQTASSGSTASSGTTDTSASSGSTSSSSSSSSQSSGSTSSGSSSTSSSSSSSSTGFIWPTTSTYVSCYYGYRVAPTAGASTYHQGIDIAGSYGDPIYAAASGTVTQAGYNSGCGNYVTISHGNGLYTVYMHCSKLYVSSGQSVSQGQTIAAEGSTGISTGPHLHFSVIVNGTYVNPMNYL